MTDQQADQLINVLTAQLCMLTGIHNSLQAMNIKAAASPGVYNFKDVQKILDATKASITQPK